MDDCNTIDKITLSDVQSVLYLITRTEYLIDSIIDLAKNIIDQRFPFKVVLKPRFANNKSQIFNRGYHHSLKSLRRCASPRIKAKTQLVGIILLNLFCLGSHFTVLEVQSKNPITYYLIPIVYRHTK